VLNKKPCLSVFIFIALAASAAGQIYVPAAADSVLSAYSLSGVKDVVYIVNVPEYEGNLNVSMVAMAPDRTGGWTFTWARYNTAANNYSSLPGSPSGASSTIDTVSVSSGYRVIMSKSGTTLTYRVWVLFNDFNVVITNKDAENKLEFGYYNCSSLDLRADTVLNPLRYYKPATDSVFTLSGFYTIRWTTDNPDASSPSSRLITRVYDPPYNDTWYRLRLTDRFGLVRTDSVFYESIMPKASVSAGYVSLGDTSEYPGKPYVYYYDDDIMSAPGKFRFDISGSRNATSYQIDFGDGDFYESSIFNDDEVVHEYLHPGIYKAKLTVKGGLPFECTDSTSVTAELAYASFSLPNVFTPNDDGDNDVLSLYDNNNVFRSVDASVTFISITIFNRAGLKVHSYEGNIRDWPGWDGLIKSSNREAPEGVYYYVISMFNAFENKDNPVGKNSMSGFFHLYREDIY